MYTDLTNLLKRLALDDLKIALGDDVCGLVEYLTSDCTKSDLVKVAIQGFGKSILEKKELRAILISSVLNKAKLVDLSKEFGIEERSLEKIVGKILEVPYGNNIRSKKILESIGLSGDYLPDEPKSKEEGVETVFANNTFYELLDYQTLIKLKILKFLREMPFPRCLVHLPTGAGKTKTAMHIITEYWTKDQKTEGYILWIAHTEELLRQAIAVFKEIWEVFGNENIHLMKLWGSFNLSEPLPSSGIVFAGTQKLISLHKKRSKQLETIRSNSRMIIIDEAHKAPAKETYSVVVDLLKKETNTSNRVLMGLTATPGRKSGYDIEDNKLKNLFDGLKIGIDLDIMKKFTIGRNEYSSEISFLQARGILSRFIRKPINFDPKELNLSAPEIKSIERALDANDKEIPKKLIDKISNNKDRNNIILERIIALHSDNHNILVFACNKSHAKLISAALNLSGLACGLILAETETSQRQQIIRDFKDTENDLRVLVNVNVLTTGFDSPNIDCVFIARPVASIILYSQMIGRGIRGPMMGGTAHCLLVEVIDGFKFGSESWAFNYFDKYWN